MRISFSAPFADALAMWRKDSALLIPVAGLTMFVPQLAQMLLLPDRPIQPEQATEEAVRAWNEATVAWFSSYGGWYVLGPVLSLFGALAIMALYLDRAHPTLAGALGRAAAVFLRYVLASILVTLPLAGLMASALVAPVLFIVVLAPILYISARTLMIAPVLVGQSSIGAVAAIGRSWRLTTGNGWALAGIYAAPFLTALLLGNTLSSLVAVTGANPVARAITSALAAAVVTAAALTIALVQVSIYRRLASNGT